MHSSIRHSTWLLLLAAFHIASALELAVDDPGQSQLPIDDKVTRLISSQHPSRPQPALLLEPYLQTTLQTQSKRVLVSSASHTTGGSLVPYGEVSLITGTTPAIPNTMPSFSRACLLRLAQTMIICNPIRQRPRVTMIKQCGRWLR